MGASAEAIMTEEEPPSFAEAWRIVWKIESLRRIWYSLPFLAVVADRLRLARVGPLRGGVRPRRACAGLRRRRVEPVQLSGSSSARASARA